MELYLHSPYMTPWRGHGDFRFCCFFLRLFIPVVFWIREITTGAVEHCSSFIRTTQQCVSARLNIIRLARMEGLIECAVIVVQLVLHQSY
jgi:hypothetical protein